MKLLAGSALAVLAAVLFVAGYVRQHAGVANSSRLRLSRPVQALRQLMVSRLWLSGWACSLAGWAAYVGAVWLAPLSLVQAANAAVIGPLAVVSDRSSTGRSRRMVVGALLAGIGILLVVATEASHYRSHRAATGSVFVVVLAGLGLYAILGLVAPVRLRGAALGVGSGLCYGVGDVATKAAVAGVPVLVPVLVGCTLLGFVSLQAAYQRTTLLRSAGLSCLFTNAVPIAIGLTIFKESPGDPWILFCRVIGFTAVVLGAVVLSTETRRGDEVGGETAVVTAP